MFWLSNWISPAEYESRESSSTDSAVLSLVAETKGKGYEVTCVPLTTKLWETRWKAMCILHTVNGEEDDEPDHVNNAKAEEWRAAPMFKRGEVTITKLDEAENVLGVASEWIELDSPDDWLRHDYEIVSDFQRLESVSWHRFINDLAGVAARTGLCVIPEHHHSDSPPSSTSKSRACSFLCPRDQRLSGSLSVHHSQHQNANILSQRHHHVSISALSLVNDE